MRVRALVRCVARWQRQFLDESYILHVYLYTTREAKRRSDLAPWQVGIYNFVFVRVLRWSGGRGGAVRPGT